MPSHEKCSDPNVALFGLAAAEQRDPGHSAPCAAEGPAPARQTPPVPRVAPGTIVAPPPHAPRAALPKTVVFDRSGRVASLRPSEGATPVMCRDEACGYEGLTVVERRVGCGAVTFG